MVEYHLRINELPASERPRERLKESGPASLSNSELLAIILRTGTAAENVLGLASRMLTRFGGLVGLARASFGELCAERGVGQAKAAQLKAALELGRRLSSTQPEERAVVRTPQDVANLLMAEMGFLDQEQLRVVLLTSKNQVVSISEVYKGNVNTSLIRPSELFREAVRENCPAIIVRFAPTLPIAMATSGAKAPREKALSVCAMAASPRAQFWARIISGNTTVKP